MRHRLAAVVIASLVASPVTAIAADGPADASATTPAFLGQVEGKAALSWVRAHNARTLAELKADPRYEPLYREALALAETRDRIPAPEMLGGSVTNFWRDAGHTRGVWRRASPASYRSAAPDWTVMLDLDALAGAEHANWVWKGASCAEPDERHCLVSLSDGGEDAVTMREFDLPAARFVAGGFALPRGKQDVAWLDDDTLLLSRDWGPGTMTASSYPFIVKRLRRGEPLAAATEIYRGAASDTEVMPVQFVDGDGHRLTLISRALTFFTFAYQVLAPDGLKPLALPPKAVVDGLVDNRLIVTLNQDWTSQGGSALAAGSVISLDAAHLDAAPQVVFAPGPTQSLDTIGITRSRVVAAIYDNVRGQAWVFTPTGGGWSQTRLALPREDSIDVADTNIHDETAFLDVTGFLDPTQLWAADAGTGSVAAIKSLPAQFDASPYVVDQAEAVSSDGARVPYFVVHRRDLAANGQNPTLLYAYGGFQVSETPTYSGALGKLWLDHGGVYVLANIRGGGEFGPRWHEAGLQTKRQHVYDDFAAVAEALISRRITSPARLGIRGGSNGGLLMGVEFTQHPALWHAVVIDVPLLDMLHYETMSAGASWVGEYGSVAVPAQRAFLAGISPLQALRPGVAYPTPYIFTTTKDDRVGPVHARRFAARMEALGLPFYYFEQVEGGHAAGANLPEQAEEQALEYTYLSRELMPAATKTRLEIKEGEGSALDPLGAAPPNPHSFRTVGRLERQSPSQCLQSLGFGGVKEQSPLPCLAFPARG